MRKNLQLKVIQKSEPMNKIKLLPEQIANKIAAGEVVQRPESVVKELIENSADAGAISIELVVKQAGKTLIQVNDNGNGMSQEDAVLSLQRHATSKIKSIEDLENLTTFGFRGEALSSIAAVSLFEIRTELKDEDTGTLIKCDGGQEISVERGSFAKGTSVSVKNIFYNVPARRNFLKSNSTELKHIIETFKNAALSNPAIEMKFYNDDDLIFDLPSSDLRGRIKDLFGEGFIDETVPVFEPTDYISVLGFVSKPPFSKKTRGEQRLFINKRYVNSRIINHAVFSSYEEMIARGDYPFYIIFIELDPKRVDVNVHPQKLEVKFEDEKGIYSLVKAVVKKSLGNYDLIPSAKFDANDNGEKLSFINGVPETGKNTNSYRGKSVFNDDEIDDIFSNLNKEIKMNTISVTHPFDDVQQKEIYHSSRNYNENESDQSAGDSFIFLLHNKYILSQIKSGLMIIDAHVAHERILYEKALQSLERNLPFSQQLLFAQEMTLDPADFELLKEIETYIFRLGFEIKFSAKNKIKISGVPSDIKTGSETDLVKEILDKYREYQQENQIEVRENLAKAYACRAAIKAGDKLNEREMRLLVDQLFATSKPNVCPHGRPIVIKIPLDELDKRFGRI